MIGPWAVWPKCSSILLKYCSAIFKGRLLASQLKKLLGEYEIVLQSWSQAAAIELICFRFQKFFSRI